MKPSHEVSKIYLMGICGTGMAALAGLLVEKGLTIAGSDSGCYAPMDKVLKELGVQVFLGYSASNIENYRPDLVIIGNVIRKDNPEARYCLESGIPYMSFPQALGEFFLADRKPLVVCGTHGKTTTSTLLLSALKGLGESPGFMIGGVPIDERRGFESGSSEWFVVEGDEYDSSFFQKVSKFMFYRPFGAIITSIEFDHADIFKDLNQIKRSFRDFITLLPKNGVVVACSDWADVMEVVEGAGCRVITYGIDSGSVWQARDISIGEKITRFIATGPDDMEIEVSLRLPGRHNCLNALSVIALCHGLGFDMHKVVQGIADCKGVKRRQEIRGEVNGIIVIDDFAHHPRAVKETLLALKRRFSDRRLIAVFEPRTNTSRRSVFQCQYARAFDNADMVLVREVPEPEKFPENDRFDSGKLVDDLVNQGITAHVFKDAGEIVEFVRNNVERGDVYAVLSNGPFEGIHERLLRAIEEKDDI